MNVVEYALRDYYKQKLNEFYHIDINFKELRECLHKHGCTSAKQTVLSGNGNGGPGDHVWTIRYFNKNLIYKVNIRRKEINIELVEVR